MLTILKNDWHRMWKQKLHLAIALALTVAAVVLGLLLTNKMAPKLHLAVQNAPAALTESKTLDRQLGLTQVKTDPGRSPLIAGRFDAFIRFQDNGHYTIKTLKPKSFKQMLTGLLGGTPGASNALVSAPRKTGGNIVSFTLMFLLMQGMLYARLFAADKEHRQLERIACSPLPFYRYLCGQALFIWLLVAAPAFLTVAIAHLLGISVGFSLPQYALLFGVIALLATAAALCINAFFKVADTANMAGTCILILTSILAGSFYKWTIHNAFFKGLIRLLPQKLILNFSDAWEQHSLSFSDYRSLIYAILMIAVLLVIAVIKTRKDYVANRHNDQS